MSEIRSFSSFLSKSLRGFELSFPTAQTVSTLKRRKGTPLVPFLHDISKSVWELERVEVIASPLQSETGRQIQFIGGIQRAGESCYVRAGLLLLLFSSSQKRS